MSNNSSFNSADLEFTSFEMEDNDNTDEPLVPTINELLQLLNTRFESIDTRFDTVLNAINGNNEQLAKTVTKVDVEEMFEDIKLDIKELQEKNGSGLMHDSNKASTISYDNITSDTFILQDQEVVFKVAAIFTVKFGENIFKLVVGTHSENTDFRVVARIDTRQLSKRDNPNDIRIGDIIQVTNYDAVETFDLKLLIDTDHLSEANLEQIQNWSNGEHDNKSYNVLLIRDFFLLYRDPQEMYKATSKEINVLRAELASIKGKELDRRTDVINDPIKYTMNPMYHQNQSSKVAKPDKDSRLSIYSKAVFETEEVDPANAIFNTILQARSSHKVKFRGNLDVATLRKITEVIDEYQESNTSMSLASHSSINKITKSLKDRNITYLANDNKQGSSLVIPDLQFIVNQWVGTGTKLHNDTGNGTISIQKILTGEELDYYRFPNDSRAYDANEYGLILFQQVARKLKEKNPSIMLETMQVMSDKTFQTIVSKNSQRLDTAIFREANNDTYSNSQSLSVLDLLEGWQFGLTPNHQSQFLVILKKALLVKRRADQQLRDEDVQFLSSLTQFTNVYKALQTHFQDVRDLYTILMKYLDPLNKPPLTYKGPRESKLAVPVDLMEVMLTTTPHSSYLTSTRINRFNGIFKAKLSGNDPSIGLFDVIDQYLAIMEKDYTIAVTSREMRDFYFQNLPNDYKEFYNEQRQITKTLNVPGFLPKPPYNSLQNSAKQPYGNNPTAPSNNTSYPRDNQRSAPAAPAARPTYQRVNHLDGPSLHLGYTNDPNVQDTLPQNYARLSPDPEDERENTLHAVQQFLDRVDGILPPDFTNCLYSLKYKTPTDYLKSQDPSLIVKAVQSVAAMQKPFTQFDRNSSSALKSKQICPRLLQYEKCTVTPCDYEHDPTKAAAIFHQRAQFFSKPSSPSLHAMHSATPVEEEQGVSPGPPDLYESSAPFTDFYEEDASEEEAMQAFARFSEHQKQQALSFVQHQLNERASNLMLVTGNVQSTNGRQR